MLAAEGAATTESWNLYVDESGPTADRGGLHVVAGLLVRGQETDAGRLRLREALQDCYPLWPWPLHAADLAIPTSRVAAALRAPPTRDESKAAGWVREAAEPLVSFVRGSSKPAAKTLLEAVEAWRGGAALDHDAIRAADAFLKGARRTQHAALARFCRGEDARFEAVLGDIAARFDQVGVVLGVSLKGAASAPVFGPDHAGAQRIVRDRYVRCLELVVERSGLLLRNGARRTITPRVADRYVTRLAGPGRGQPKTGPLFHGRVRSIVEQALVHPDPGFAGASGLLRVDPIPGQHLYNADAHPGLVLADWIANRARRALSRLGRGGDALAQLRVHSALGDPKNPLPVLFAPLRGGDALPTVAGDGAAREAVRSALAGEETVELPDDWTGDLAAPWVERARGWRS
jgi:hypothetical protein